MPARLDEAAKIVRDAYLADKPDATFINCVTSNRTEWDYGFFAYDQNKKGNFYIENIEIVPSSFSSYATDAELKGQHLRFQDRTGLFKVTFNNKSFMYIAKWFVGIGKNMMIQSMFGTENETWIKFLAMSKKKYIRHAKPKSGVYLAEMTMVGLRYEPYKSIPNNVLFHDAIPKIKESVNYYFKNVPTFMKYNQPGRRSILLYGEPGTAKTSTLYQLAAEHKDTKSVVFCNDINAMHAHIKSCEKYNVPTLVFFEDCESIFCQNNSSVKNFLSGANAGRNRAGTCIVYTSNYPQDIEETIIERPERIDELHYIGTISGQTLIDCAKYYFGEYAPREEDLRTVLVKPMTGAEVKLFTQNCFQYCASRQAELSVTTMKEVLDKYRLDVKQLQDFTKGKTKKSFRKDMDEPGRMGFRPSNLTLAWETKKSEKELA